MKKIVFSLCAILIIVSCSKDAVEAEQQQIETNSKTLLSIEEINAKIDAVFNSKKEFIVVANNGDFNTPSKKSILLATALEAISTSRVCS